MEGREAKLGVVRIFQLLEKGVDSSKILDILDDRQKFMQEQDRRGYESEQNAVTSILELPMVDSIQVAQKFSKPDRKGIDITVDLKPELSKIPKVKVQVKSSTWGMRKFITKLSKERGIPENEVRDWLTNHNWILINGALPKEQVAAAFTTQLDAINSRDNLRRIA